MRFVKRSVEVEAVEWTGTFGPDLAGFIGDRATITEDGVLQIKTLEGTMTATVGDMIVRGVKGEF